MKVYAMPSVFISHSAKDKPRACDLADRLRQRGINVWIDHEQILPGDRILNKIEKGLENSYMLLILTSKNSINSPWCRNEYESALHREIQSESTNVVAIRLDNTELPRLLEGKRYIDFQKVEDNDAIETLIDLLLQRQREAPKACSPSDYYPCKVDPDIAKGLIFLLLLDQYPEGVWGKSLAEVCGTYGHKEDPGSITVSCWVANMLTTIFHIPDLPEINTFRDFLLGRWKTNGAVGMRRKVGGWPNPTYELVEHRRHTALVAQFLKNHGNALDKALHSLKYVIECQTRSGAWSATEENLEANADPLTTAYILRVLRDFQAEGYLTKIYVDKGESFFKTYWKRGMRWLDHFAEEHHFLWPYCRYSEMPNNTSTNRTYCNTADVLMALPEFPNEDSQLAATHQKILTTLTDVWDENGKGLPASFGDTIPDLDTTVYVTRTCWLCRNQYPKLYKRIVPNFISSLDYLLVEGTSDAAGWSTTLLFLIDELELTNLSKDDLQDARMSAHEVLMASNSDGISKITEMLKDRPDWVTDIASKKILREKTQK